MNCNTFDLHEGINSLETNFQSEWPFNTFLLGIESNIHAPVLLKLLHKSDKFLPKFCVLLLSLSPLINSIKSVRACNDM